QAANNLRVRVEDGPHGFSLAPNANILYVTVTVCVPGGSPANPAECQVIDHVQVDTGSVGLRVLASKVKALNLPRVTLSAAGDAVTRTAWECFPFVVGGLWGANAGADVWLGQQVGTRIPLQLIEDDTQAALQATSDCVSAADHNVLDSAAALGSNGILGIGSTTLDCGQNCEAGDYTGSFVQYYSCPQTATASAGCSPTAVPAALQVYNPVAALPAAYNNGVVLKMPAVTDPGAATASGELVFGLNSLPNNTLPATARKVFLGVDYLNRPDSYLNVTTRFNGQSYASSYLDTGTNGLFFSDAAQIRCQGTTWYCPAGTQNLNAQLSDGDNPLANAVTVAFQLANAEALFSTNNTAFSGAAGAAPAGSVSFAWGMPFFYGKSVFLSIWQQAGALSGPWYAWTTP
ncbi:MAG: DUF3443 family protein, partial [Rhodoferax sp.]|nr:DUF3443 family protein [Rhodoferax sp.]